MEMQKRQRVQKIQIMENVDGHICWALTRESGVRNFRYAKKIQKDEDGFSREVMSKIKPKRTI